MQRPRTILVILSVFSVLFCLQFAGIGFPALQAKLRPNISAAVTAAGPRVAWKRFAKLTPSDGQIGDIFESAVAIAGDVIVVGNETANIGKNISQGAAYIFVKPSNGWHDMTQTAKLTASDGQYNDSFGHSVAIRGDTVAIGAYCHLAQIGSCPGAVYVFKKPKDGWTDMTQTAELTASDDHSQYGYHLGWSAAIGPDYTITCGAVSAAVNDAGAVYVFLKPPNGWRDKTQDAELTASDGQPFDGLGNSVSYNGNTVAAGAQNWPNGRTKVPVTSTSSLQPAGKLQLRRQDSSTQIGGGVTTSQTPCLLMLTRTSWHPEPPAPTSMESTGRGPYTCSRNRMTAGKTHPLSN